MSDTFSIFDIYSEVEIDLSGYISNISNLGVNYTFSNKQPVVTTIKNLFDKVDFISDFRKNIDLIYNYKISEDETMEQCSLKNYGTIDLWWIVLLFNDIKNPIKDWPMNNQQLNELANSMFQNEGKYSKDAYYRYLFNKNETQRNIILPKQFVIPDIIWKYRELEIL